jgi:DNA-binding phage protein
MCYAGGMETLSQEAQYKLMKGWLNERQWRLYVATEAKRIGPGGISQVAREAGVTRKTIRKGLSTITQLFGHCLCVTM